MNTHIKIAKKAIGKERARCSGKASKAKQEVFMKSWMDDSLRLALLKENAAYRGFWERFGIDILLAADRQVREYYAENPDPTGGGRLEPNPACSAEASLGKFFRQLIVSFGIAFDGECPNGNDLERLLDILNPYHRADLPDDLPSDLPFYFHKYPPVAQVVGDCDKRKNNSHPHEHDYCVSADLTVDQLKPWERLLRIDLRGRKKEIIDEISRYLDRVEERRKTPDRCKITRITRDCRIEEIDWFDNYKEWQADASRKSKAQQHLKIWRMRRQRKSFPEIANEMGLSADNAKKSFYTAYELINGRPYDREKFNEKYREVEAKGLRKPCDDCLQKQSCDPKHDPCPDLLDWFKSREVEAYASQEGKGSSREKIPSKEMPESAADPCPSCPEKSFCDDQSGCRWRQADEDEEIKKISVKSKKTSDECPFCHTPISGDSSGSICSTCETVIPSRK